MELIHIDDNAADRLLVKDLLEVEHRALNLKQFATIQDAIAHLNQFYNDKNLVLLDLVIPPYRGLETLELILSDFPLIPIIVVTGTGNIEIGKEAIKMGAIDYLLKDELSPQYLERSLRYAQERMHLIRDLKESNATKDKLLSVIAHDLRSPISSIEALAELMKSDIAAMNREELKSELLLLHRSTEKASGLLSNLLDWSRVQLGKKVFELKEICLNDILEEVISFFKEMAEAKQIELHFSKTENYSVEGDWHSMLSIFRNLLHNALKFSHRNSIVNIDLASVANFVEVSIADRGIGIPATILENLFAIGSNTGRAGTEGEASSGLGLLLVDTYLKKNNASLKVVSKENLGSTFIVRLPRATINRD